MKHLPKILILFILIVVPLGVFSSDTGSIDEGVVPSDCGDFVPTGNVDNENNPIMELKECGFVDLIQLIENFIDILILIAVPLAVILFAYAGFLYITAAGNTNQIERAHTIFKNVFIGFVIILAAWLVVNAIVTSLVGDDYSLLEDIS